MYSNVEKIVRKVLSEVSSLSGSDKKAVTLSKGSELCKRVRERATQLGIKVVVAVADDGGNVVCVERMDDAYIASYDIAVNKAYTCVALKMSTKQLEKLAKPDGELYGIQFTNGGKIVIFGGGEPLKINGVTVGGIGVSGGTNEQDTALATYGAQVWEELIN